MMEGHSNLFISKTDIFSAPPTGVVRQRTLSFLSILIQHLTFT